MSEYPDELPQVKQSGKSLLSSCISFSAVLVLGIIRTTLKKSFLNFKVFFSNEEFNISDTLFEMTFKCFILNFKFT